MSSGEASVVHNGKPSPHGELSELSNEHSLLDEMPNEGTGNELLDEPPVIQIERDLDELTYSGAAINDLEVQLTRTKHLYQQVLVEGKMRVDVLRKKLHSHIIKSEPFVEIWRRARQVQEMSNRAAARYDKANSQHLAAKEMIRVAESQLEECRAQQKALDEEPSSPSPLDLAWQEMLNHATNKVVLTEKERRDSEIEHRKFLEECKIVMDNYRIIERKLRNNIIKSRPYFQERYRVNQHLEKLKATMKGLEQRINESKQSYSASLRRLEALNAEIHEQRRGFQSGKLPLDPRKVSSTGSSPEMRRLHQGDRGELEEVASMDSIQIGADFHGSTGSLPSIGVMSHSPSYDSDLERSSLEPDRGSSALHKSQSSPDRNLNVEEGESEVLSTRHPLFVSTSFPSDHSVVSQASCDSEPDALDQLASQLTVQCLAKAVSKLNQEGRSSNSPLA